MKLVSLKQDTKEWFDFRRNKIGASDAPVIMEISPWKTPYKLWQEKLGLVSYPEMNNHMQRGKDMEPLALQSINERLGLSLYAQVYQHETEEFMIASMDGYDTANEVGCEIKCPQGKDHDLALQGKIPDKYIPQLQHQMEVCELEWIYYYSYNGQENALLKLERNDKYIKNLKKQERIFWEYLENLECPKLNEKDFVQTFDKEWERDASEWIYVQNKIRELTYEEEALRKRLVERSNNQNTMGFGVKVSKILRKGNIQYGNIPELKNVDLEKYRKEPSEFYRISAM